MAAAPAMLLILIAAVPLIAATWPIRDVDSYWHVRIGDELRSGAPIVGLGESWAWYDPPEPWTTSQWLSEWTMSWLVDALGWDGLVYAKFLVTTLLVVLLGALALVSRDGWSSTFVFAVAALHLATVVQVRPVLVSYVGTLAIGAIAARVLRYGLPPPWYVVPGVAIWANFHGQWIVAPLALGLAVALQYVRGPRPDRAYTRRSAGVLLATLVAGCLNPLGWRSLLLPLQFTSATDHLIEWQPTQPWSWGFLPMATLVALLAARWLWGGVHASLEEVLYAAVWVTFAMVATRNVTTALLILTALALLPRHRQAATEFERDGADPPSRSRRGTLIGLSAAFTLAVSASALSSVDALAQTQPLRIATQLRANEGELTVLNDYNVAGVLVALGPPQLQVGIDGRAERYGAEYISRYLDALALRGDTWSTLLREMEPDVAVLEVDSPMRHILEEDREWIASLVDGDYVLLEPPSPAASPTNDG